MVEMFLTSSGGSAADLTHLDDLEEIWKVNSLVVVSKVREVTFPGWCKDMMFHNVKNLRQDSCRIVLITKLICQ